MSLYEPNPDVRPTEAEADELIDTDPRPDRDSDEPGLDTDNLPGDNRPPASARPLRDRPDE
jgi:hypothetical protein